MNDDDIGSLIVTSFDWITFGLSHAFLMLSLLAGTLLEKNLGARLFHAEMIAHATFTALRIVSNVRG